MKRKILAVMLLVLILAIAVVIIGALGLGKTLHAPGLDDFVHRILRKDAGGSGPASDTTLLWNIEEIAGTWSGVSDVDGTVWKFTFEKNFAVRASSSSGYSRQGTAFVHWRLGQTDGAIRVPPGWSPLDVDIIDSSEQSHRNSSSLGAFTLKGKVLHYCFSEPGRMLRPINDMSREGIRCFELTRGTAADIGASTGGAGTPAQPRAVPPPMQTGQGSARRSDAGAQALTGEAEVTIDGRTERWPLRTDPDSSTDTKSPIRMTLQFQAHGLRLPAARRIEFTFDATRVGRHRADGKVYRENRFIREKVPVGSGSTGEPEAIALYIDESGQIFPPRDFCSLVVMVPYGRQAETVAEGRLSSCEFFSAGTLLRISSVEFRVKRGGSR